MSVVCVCMRNNNVLTVERIFALGSKQLTLHAKCCAPCFGLVWLCGLNVLVYFNFNAKKSYVAVYAPMCTPPTSLSQIHDHPFPPKLTLKKTKHIVYSYYYIAVWLESHFYCFRDCFIVVFALSFCSSFVLCVFNFVSVYLLLLVIHHCEVMCYHRKPTNPFCFAQFG